MNKQIVKSAGECMRRGWFSLREPVLPQPSASDKLLSFYGERVGLAARKEFPSGVLIAAPNFATALAETQRHLACGTDTLFEAAFSFAGVSMKADVFRRQADSRFDLIEVKAGLEPAQYYEDVAVQVWVLKKLGMMVHPFLMLLDPEATSESPSLFRLVDCQNEVATLLPDIEERIGAIREACRSDQWPTVPYTRGCRDCDFLSRCLPRLPKQNVFSLYRGGKKIDRLLATGIRSLERLPTGLKLSPIQQRQVRSIRSNRARVSPELTQRLHEVRYPLRFLDFECLAHPLPQYSGQRCYALTPFQWSCHTKMSADAAPEHEEFLMETPGDPRPDFAATLLRCLGDSGSILVYTAYESRIIKALAIDLPHLSGALLSLLPRVYDLHEVVRKHVYHPDFCGSYSIKSVLPAIVPGFDYSALEIQDGLAAVWSFLRMQADGVTEAERQRLAASLRQYCAADSMALVKVYEALLAFANGERGTE